MQKNQLKSQITDQGDELVYLILSGLSYLFSIFLFIYGLIDNRYQYFWWTGLLLFIFYPIVLESIFYLVLKVFGQKRNLIKLQNQSSLSLESTYLVYNKNYNVFTCQCLTNLHPFDSEKYQNVYKRIQDEFSFYPNKYLISRSFLYEYGISLNYLIKLNYSIFIFRIVEVPICFLPAFYLRIILLHSQLYASMGSLESAELALVNDKNWAINLAGGYHHASRNQGSGFCIYPDISLVSLYLLKNKKANKIIIIDLDAHQGNGYEKDLIGNQDVIIMDFYNHNIYPGDLEAKQAIYYDVQVTYQHKDKNYLDQLEQSLNILEKDIISQFKNQDKDILIQEFNSQQKKIQNNISKDKLNTDFFIIYNAGTDILKGDNLGRLNISEQGIIQRDQMVFSFCQRLNIPAIMLLSGGYQKNNAQIIAKSIQNMFNTSNKI